MLPRTDVTNTPIISDLWDTINVNVMPDEMEIEPNPDTAARWSNQDVQPLLDAATILLNALWRAHIECYPDIRDNYNNLKSALATIKA